MPTFSSAHSRRSLSLDDVEVDIPPAALARLGIEVSEDIREDAAR